MAVSRRPSGSRLVKKGGRPPLDVTMAAVFAAGSRRWPARHSPGGSRNYRTVKQSSEGGGGGHAVLEHRGTVHCPHAGSAVMTLTWSARGHGEPEAQDFGDCSGGAQARAAASGFKFETVLRPTPPGGDRLWVRCSASRRSRSARARPAASAVRTVRRRDHLLEVGMRPQSGFLAS